MFLEQVIPSITKEGNEYLIKFSEFKPESLPIRIEIKVIDITLYQVKKVKQNSPELISYLADYFFEYLQKFDVIIYYYCDHVDVEMRKTRSVSPQRYRNDFFNAAYRKISNEALIRKQIIIDDEENGDHYITIITSKKMKMN